MSRMIWITDTSIPGARSVQPVDRRTTVENGHWRKPHIFGPAQIIHPARKIGPGASERVGSPPAPAGIDGTAGVPTTRVGAAAHSVDGKARDRTACPSRSSVPLRRPQCGQQLQPSSTVRSTRTLKDGRLIKIKKEEEPIGDQT